MGHTLSGADQSEPVEHRTLADGLFRRRLPSPGLLPAAAGVYLVLAFFAVWVVDVRETFGGPARLEADGLDPPFVWFQLFMDGGLTELAQWTLLAALIVLAAAFAVAHRLGAVEWESQARHGAFWTLVAVLAAVMLIEDAGNPRHLLVHYVGVATSFDPRATALAEAAYYGAIGLLGLYAFLRHGRGLARMPGVRGLGAAGVACYALAVGMSATRTIGDWYQPFGAWLIDRVLDAPHIADGALVADLDDWQLRFLFPDFVVEESLELLGAAFLVAAALAYARTVRGDVSSR